MSETTLRAGVEHSTRARYLQLAVLVMAAGAIYPLVYLRQNFEVTMLLVDTEFARDVQRMLEDDFAASREVSATEYTEAPLWFRLVVRIARLLAPIQ